MDFESLINIMIIVLFLVGTSIVRKLKQKKIKPLPDKQDSTGLKGFSLFEKISDRIRAYAEELELQAKTEKEKPGTGFWDSLADDQKETSVPLDQTDMESALAESSRTLHETEVDKDFMDKPDFEVPLPEKRQGFRPAKQGKTCSAPLGGQAKNSLKTCRLQQAVVWSEILGKPIALRND